MGNKSVILHIGQFKTGSSSIQKFLDNNCGLLNKCGVLYPKVLKVDKAHHLLATKFVDINKHRVPSEFISSDSLELLKNEINQSESNVVVISSEHFSNVVELESLIKLRQFFIEIGIENILIVCFFRRQDLWLESAFSQEYKIGTVDFNILSSLRPRVDILDYNLFLSPWESIFGIGNISVNILDKEKGDSDAVEKFCRILLGSDSALIKKSKQAGRANVRLSPVCMHYSHLVHRYKKTIHIPKTIVGYFFSSLIEVIPVEIKYVFLTDKQRYHLLSYYEASNDKLAEKYLDRKKAFSDFNTIEKGTLIYPTLDQVDIQLIPESIDKMVGLVNKRSELVSNVNVDADELIFSPKKAEVNYISKRPYCDIQYDCRVCGMSHSNDFPVFQQTKINCTQCGAVNWVVPFKYMDYMSDIFSLSLPKTEIVFWGAGEIFRLLNTAYQEVFSSQDDWYLVDSKEIFHGFSMCSKEIYALDIIALKNIKTVAILTVSYEEEIIAMIKNNYPSVENILLLDIVNNNEKVVPIFKKYSSPLIVE